MDGKADKATEKGMELLRTEMEKLKKELKTSGDGWCCALILELLVRPGMLRWIWENPRFHA